MTRRLLISLALVTGPVLALTPPASAGVNDPGLEPGGGIPGSFGAFFVLALLIGVGVTIFKVVTARSMARRSGLDPDQATAVTLLGEDGLDATYLAANLRGPGSTPPSTPAPTVRSPQERLQELASLRDQGLLTPEEYDARRKLVLDSL
ncbi:MAG: SHOCT domain-containing protein [Nocardioides sp.]